MDTDNLTRGVSELDINIFYHLYNLSDIGLITALKGNQISQEDLKDFDTDKSLHTFVRHRAISYVENP